MKQSSAPVPPETDNPIVVLRSISLHEELKFLDELLSAQAQGNVDRAAKCATVALSSALTRATVNAMVSVVNNLAVEQDSWPASLTTLLCRATDAGFHEYAYNAANRVMNLAKGVGDYKEAERYFKLAMAFKENPKIQAAAYVNYCPIVRDGLITGVPDWPAGGIL